MCCFSAGNRHFSKKEYTYITKWIKTRNTYILCLLIFFFWRDTFDASFSNISKYLKMPRNAVMKHMLTIYMFALLPVSTKVRNLSSSIVQRFIGTNSRKKFIVWYLLLRVKVHFSWTKLGLADPFLRNRNFVFCCGMHIETLPVQMTDFQPLSAEDAVTWQKGRHVWSGSIG